MKEYITSQLKEKKKPPVLRKIINSANVVPKIIFHVYNLKGMRNVVSFMRIIHGFRGHLYIKIIKIKNKVLIVLYL